MVPPKRYAVLEGGLPFTKAYGMTAVEYVGKDARLGEVFKTSMTDYNLLFMERVLEIYKGFEGLKCLVDVGGGDGSILNMIISKHPTLKGINFDLPQVIEKSPAFPEVDNVPGDMFVSIPNGDAIFMKWILHTWDDEDCLKILKNCYKALPLNGKAIVVDMVIPEASEATLSLRSLYQFHLFMMNMNPKGKERTEREFEILGKAAGFSNIQVACSAFNFSVVELHK
ncbi:caffeic acid 3-O-methyltransferase [Tripterygium wilfordii]|uniref:Caffeic acid 3-O-methyltransferase n=1 Tax=Tripterygium wilfordii TaxID=458696 RepID=A0A7J7CJZ7_TRIWF|nr:caffeic acid 3-O-methyltransferase [Tripterygium wilfordii]